MGHERHIRDVHKMSACPPTPDISLRRGERQKRATSGLMHRNKKALFDYLVSAAEQRERVGQAK